MKPERWRQVDELFLAALERAPGERAAFLDEACTGDASLREEVESLLASYERADRFLEKPAVEMAGEVLAADDAVLAAGQRLGHYDIVRPLGEGGMGQVYLAEDGRLGRRVALKLLPPSFIHASDRVRRFEQEARAASMLNHPNVCVIHEVGTTEDGRHFIVMEHVEGQTLRRRLREGLLPLDEALEIAVQVASALTAAHAAGIVHRDIKPENLMLRPDGFVKVLDFGLAKLTEQPASVRTDARILPQVDTGPGVVLGTVTYMSPEQLRGRGVDTRSDIFRLGVVLYEMFGGRLPFKGETAADLTVAILKTEPPPLNGSRPDLPRELDHIVAKALRGDREVRYQHVKDLLIDLKDLKQELALAARMERSFPPDARADTALGSEQETARTAEGKAATTREEPVADTGPSARAVTGGVARYGKGVALALVVLAMAAATTAYFKFFAARPEPIQSIAILPFANGSGDPELDYLSEGISESLINSLSQVPNLRVIARSSAFRYRGSEVDPQTVARELGVHAVLTGRTVQRGENLSISAELVDARDNSHLWGAQYNRKLADVLALQAEIASEISEKLRLRLTGEDEKRLAKQYTENTEAYRLYLKGRYYWNKRNVESFEKAIESFSQAIETDPSYALAYAGLADAYAMRAEWSPVPRKEDYSRAVAEARRALAIDDMLAEGHASLAFAIGCSGDLVGAEREFRRAIELKPNYATAHHWYGNYLLHRGRRSEGMAELERALELDPLSLIINTAVGGSYYSRREYDRAIEQLRKTVELEPSFIPAREFLGAAYLQKGRYDEAIVELQKAVELSGGREVHLSRLGHAYAMSGRRAEAQRVLDELKDLRARREISATNVALVYAGLGEYDQTFSWLEKAYQEQDYRLQTLLGDPVLYGLRSDPRFDDLMRRVRERL